VAGLAAAAVRGWLAEGDHGLVVALYPIAVQCLGAMRADGSCPVPVLAYLTDPGLHEGWVHPGVDLFVTVSEATAEQGRRAGLPVVAGGPLVADRFARPVAAEEVARLSAELGVPPGRPVALVVAGSLGVGPLAATAADVAAAGFVPLVLCGRNEALRRRVSSVPGVVALGWRDDVPLLLHLADVVVQNAGGMALTEALVTGVPAVTYRAIPGHGRANAAALDRAGLVPWARSRRQLAAALHRQAARGRRPLLAGDPTEQVVALLDRAAPARR
jgi:UDP-N-acetylglucosamine:LPS N-acetylglucosamine transferase